MVNKPKLVNSSYRELVSFVEKMPDMIEEYGEIAKIFPYSKHVVAAYRWARTARIKRFLHSLSSVIDELSEEQRRKFDKIINSEAGGELLAEYSDAVLRTSSKTAIAALAILYADVDDKKYVQDFKVAACLVFQGITENSVEAFLELSRVSEVAEPINGKGPYPMFSADDSLLEKLPNLRKLHRNAEELIISTNELIRRGLLLPEHFIGRYGGTTCPFGVSDITHRFRELLILAKKYAARQAKDK